MISVGARDLKNNLSAYLRLIRKGAEVCITVHGNPVARMVPEGSGTIPLQNRLASLAARGVLALPNRAFRKKNGNPIKSRGRPVSDIVIEGRR